MASPIHRQILQSQIRLHSACQLHNTLVQEHGLVTCLGPKEACGLEARAMGCQLFLSARRAPRSPIERGGVGQHLSMLPEKTNTLTIYVLENKLPKYSYKSLLLETILRVRLYRSLLPLYPDLVHMAYCVSYSRS